MTLVYEEGLRVLVSDTGKLITDQARSFFAERLYLGVDALPDQFVEVDESERPIEEEQINGSGTGQI